MRLFVAIEVEAPIAERIGALSAELQRRAKRSAPHARVTWVAPQRMHLTVRFIGKQDEAQAARLASALEPPIAVAPFTLTFAGVGAFPPHGGLRVIWAGVSSGADALAAVEREVTARLARCGVPPEDRVYRPHLTLARVRDAAGLRRSSLLDGIPGDAFGTMRVGAITLFESRLSPKGSLYVPLHRTVLAGRSDMPAV